MTAITNNNAPTVSDVRIAIHAALDDLGAVARTLELAETLLADPLRSDQVPAMLVTCRVAIGVSVRQIGRALGEVEAG